MCVSAGISILFNQIRYEHSYHTECSYSNREVSCKNTLLFYFHIPTIAHKRATAAGAAAGTYVTSTPFLVFMVMSASGIGTSSGISIAPIQL